MSSPEFDDVLGLEQKVVRLQQYTSVWADLFVQEERRLRACLKTLAVDIQHYGSTSIPGIQAKPILDILVGIAHFEEAPLCIPLLEAIGYDYAPYAGIPGDFTFGKGERRTHLVYVVAHGASNWTDSLRFRDALRQDCELAHEYEALKSNFAQKFPKDRAAYTMGKTNFIQQVLSVHSGS